VAAGCSAATGSSVASGSRLPVVGLVAAAGGFLFGYDTAVINGANQYVSAHFALSSAQEGVAAASAILGCIPGAIVAGFLSDRYGRKRALLLCAVLFALSGVASALPSTFTEFLVARFFSGIAIGISSMVCPVYVSECAPANSRGRLGTLFQLGIVVGILVTFFVNAAIQGQGDANWNQAIGWRWMLGAEAIPALLLLCTLPLAPESSRWLAQESGHIGELFQKRFRRPLVIAVGVAAIAQLSGINAVMYYSTRIFTGAGVGVGDAFTSTVIIGCVNLLFTLVALVTVDRAGRRALLLIGLLFQIASLSTVAWSLGTHSGGTLLLVAILVFIAAFALALGPIPWLLGSEVFPARIRGRAMSVVSFSVWISCYVVAQTFPVLNDTPAIGPAGTFALYAAVSVVGLLFTWRLVPETKGRSLEDIEASWGAG